MRTFPLIKLEISLKVLSNNIQIEYNNMGDKHEAHTSG